MKFSRYIPLFLFGAGCWFSFAVTLLAHPDLEDQVARVTKLIEKEPGNAAFYLRRGELYRIHREWNLASADYDRAEQLDPGMTSVDLARGQMLLEAGKPDKALVPLGRLLKRLPYHPEGHALRARAWVALKDTEAAVADYNAAVTNAAETAVAYYTARAQLLAVSRPDEAVRGLDEGIARLGPVGTLESYAINLLVTQGRYDDALARLDTMLARAHRKESLLLERGQILEKAGQPQSATESYRQAMMAIEALPSHRRHVPAMKDLSAKINSALQQLERQANNAP